MTRSNEYDPSSHLLDGMADIMYHTSLVLEYHSYHMPSFTNGM